MSTEFPDLWQFDEFRLDVRRKVLWHRDEAVAMPLKELEVLSMLVRSRGELVTKNELLDEIWADSFVEESNLSRHIYLLRKTLKDFGAADGLIENVPRRGYRFAGDVHVIEPDEIHVERRTRTRTLIEFQDQKSPSRPLTRFVAFAAIAVMFVGVSAFFAARYLGDDAADTQIRSIAVLPFNTLGAGTEGEHTGAGLADILVTRLSSIKALKVRPAIATVGLGAQSASAAGEKLQVDAVLEGTIFYAGERVRLTARLVRTRDAAVIWSGEFEKLRSEELQLQNELAMRMVPVLALNLSSGERDALDKTYTQSADAYDLYLRGRHEWNKRSTPGMIEAQRLFRNAIAADPSFSLAYVGLADALLTHQPSRNEAAMLIAKALELDANLAEAHASRGFYLMFMEWQWDGAEVAFKRSLELNPNYATAHHWYATLLAIRGQTEEAKVEMHRALELNPLSYNFLADLGQLYYFSGDYAAAEKYCVKALEIYPDFSFGHEYLHYIYLKTGEFDKAVAELEKADYINSAYNHGSSGKSEMQKKLNTAFQTTGIGEYFEERYPGIPFEPHAYYLYAKKYAFLGEDEKALEYLEKSIDTRQFLSAFLRADPLFERLHSDPRYQKILQKIGLV